ncbi:MAG: 4Fe-4S dicluster domain-containing protein [Puniceicoccales bacterium]|jgi:NAD-dependent dihydropyrimidine dehydrogenase PreA subunit|nr:4Fe-4S dicluster domain-containing protein [Puniceicoccales bacterium]
MKFPPIVRPLAALLAWPAAIAAFLLSFPFLQADEWLALAGGVAVVMIASAEGLAHTRRVAAGFALFAAAVIFANFTNTVPADAKHAFAAAQFGPSALAFATGTFCSAAFIFILAVTAVIGRIYCSALCPLGLLQDVFSRVAEDVRKLRDAVISLRTGKAAPRRKRLGYAPAAGVLRQSFLVATLLGVAAGWAGFVFAWLDPYSQFGRIAAGLLRPVAVFANNLTANFTDFISRETTVHPWAGFGALLPPLAILSVVAVMSALRGRLYCNAVCPVGTLLGWVSKKAVFRVSIDKTSCKRCGDCVSVCKAQCIDLTTQEVDASRCVGCFNCVAVCDDRGINPNWLGRAAAKGKRLAKIVKRGEQNSGTAAATATATAGLSRRGFLAGAGGVAFAGAVGVLGGKFAKAESQVTAVAPPGAGSRLRFTAQCTACQLCVAACPVGLLEPALFEYGSASGFMKPRMNYAKNYCKPDCIICIETCPVEALLPLTKEQKNKTRIGIAKLEIEKCIVREKNTACGQCQEHCPVGALQMIEVPGKSKFAEPKIDEAICIGCGACEYACPALPQKAIIIYGASEHTLAQEIRDKKPAEDPNSGEDIF